MSTSEKKCIDCSKKISKKSIRCKSCANKARSKKEKNKCKVCDVEITRKAKLCIKCYKESIEVEKPKCHICKKELVNQRSKQCLDCYRKYVSKREENKKRKSLKLKQVAKSAWKNNDDRRKKLSSKMKKIWSNKEEKEKMLNAISKSKRNTSKLELSLEKTLFEHGFLNNDKIGEYIVDYSNKYYKVIIEVYGDYWHCNPEKYSYDYIHPHLKVAAKEVWDRDKRRLNYLKSRGYDVIILWESQMKSEDFDVLAFIKKYNIPSNVVDKYKGKTTEEILKDLEKNQLGFSVCIDNIEYNYNLGACIRNANAFGANEIFYIGKKKIDRRSTVGAHHVMKINHLSVNEIEKIKENYTLIALETKMPNSHDLYEFVWPKNTCLVLGNESNGIRKEILDQCDHIVHIPQRGSVRSLNAAVAGGIAMSHVSRMLS